MGTTPRASATDRTLTPLGKGHARPVSLLHAETTGALGAIFMTVLRVLAKQSRLPGATDLTQYGEGRASPKRPSPDPPCRQHIDRPRESLVNIVRMQIIVSLSIIRTTWCGMWEYADCRITAYPVCRECSHFFSPFIPLEVRWLYTMLPVKPYTGTYTITLL